MYNQRQYTTVPLFSIFLQFVKENLTFNAIKGGIQVLKRVNVKLTKHSLGSCTGNIFRGKGVCTVS